MSKLFASKYMYQERLGICKSCAQFQPTIKMCKSCGCFMPAKAKIANIACPEDKWGAVYGTDDKEPTTMSLFNTLSNEEKSESLKRQAEHLKQESERLIEEANKLNGID